MIVYDVEIPDFAKNLRAASLLSFQEGLISKIELIYDSRCFMDERDPFLVQCIPTLSRRAARQPSGDQAPMRPTELRKTSATATGTRYFSSISQTR